jgi:CDP-diacylglycerol--glycerol-3-phosphate 3-phosphatidyltransferase/cardiolipin synthase
MRLNLPTWLTLLRVLAIPVLVGVLLIGERYPDWLAASIFAAAAVTDWLDGWLARKLNQTSSFGAFLDPVADKLMVATALVMLVYADPRLMVMLPAMVIIGREITISALREWMAELGQRTHVAVSSIGKYKTAMQLIAIGLMLLKGPAFYGYSIYQLGLTCLWLAAVLTVWSMVMYLRAAWPTLRGETASKT